MRNVFILHSCMRYSEVNKVETYEGFCVKCRKKVTIKNPEIVTLKNNRKAVKGVCPNCGTTVYRFLGKA